MQMLPTLGKDSSVTDNGHFLVQPAPYPWGYLITNTVTDEPYTEPDPDGNHLVRFFTEKADAEGKARDLAKQSIDNA